MSATGTIPAGAVSDAPGTALASGRPWVMLTLATLGFAVNFWAWALLSPLGPRFKDSLHLTPSSSPCWWRSPWSSAPWGGSRSVR